MVEPDHEPVDDDDVPLQALQGLTEAQRRWMQSGQIVVVVRNDQLIRIMPDGETVVIRELPPQPVISDLRRTFGS
jgi:hypothetical protein